MADGSKERTKSPRSNRRKSSRKRKILTDEEIKNAKENARYARILRVYGITRDQYQSLDLGHCPICLRDWSDDVRPCVDHDHVSGEVRGLLCIFCNRYRVGRLRDASLVQRIADYLSGPFRGWIVPKKKKVRRRNRAVLKKRK